LKDELGQDQCIVRNGIMSTPNVQFQACLNVGSDSKSDASRRCRYLLQDQGRSRTPSSEGWYDGDEDSRVPVPTFSALAKRDEQISPTKSRKQAGLMSSASPVGSQIIQFQKKQSRSSKRCRLCAQLHRSLAYCFAQGHQLLPVHNAPAAPSKAPAAAKGNAMIVQEAAVQSTVASGLPRPRPALIRSLFLKRPPQRAPSEDVGNNNEGCSFSGGGGGGGGGGGEGNGGGCNGGGGGGGGESLGDGAPVLQSHRRWRA
jgi:hypothetical protein